MGFAATTLSAEVRKDIEYSQVNGVGLRLDASIPDGAGPFPAVIIVHGGGWVRGDRAVDVAPLFQPLSDAGFAWFSISYRLANNVAQFGSAIRDVEDAIRFVKAHADEFSVDPKRLALIGESAGGQLAEMAALSDDPDLQVRAVVGLYAPSDLVSLVKTSNLVPKSMRDSIRGTPWEGLLTKLLAQLSPIENVRKGMPPFLLIHGTADPLVPFEQSQALCERMQGVAAACELYPVEGGGHGIRGWENSKALSTGYKREMVRWLRQRLAAPDLTSSPVLNLL